MSSEYVGRKHDDEYYRYHCDKTDCDNKRTFQAEQTEKVSDWKVAKMFEDGIITEIRHICPKHS